LSVETYHAMIGAGIFTENDRVELIEGWLIEHMPKYPPHTAANEILYTLLLRVLPPGWVVRSQQPITLQDSEPEPDICIAKGTHQEYFFRHPSPPEIVLVIEVSDSTLMFDKGRKKRMYARAGIALYGVLNLIDRQFELYSNPDNGDYQTVVVYPADQAFPVVIDEQMRGHIAVKDLLPPLEQS
jgi:Uma2 family endonuclease